MGRKPKPSALKLIQGIPGKRPLNDAEPAPATVSAASPAPAHMTKEGREAWATFAPLVVGMGVLTVADGPALERLCETYGELRRLSALLELLGETYETKSVSGELLVRARPECARLSDADRRFRGYLSDFGLSPAARARVKVNPNAANADPTDKYFG